MCCTGVADRRCALLDEGLGDITSRGGVGVIHGVRRLLDLELVALIGSRRWIEVAELTRIHHQALVVCRAGDGLECGGEDSSGWLLRSLRAGTVRSGAGHFGGDAFGVGVHHLESGSAGSEAGLR